MYFQSIVYNGSQKKRHYSNNIAYIRRVCGLEGCVLRQTFAPCYEFYLSPHSTNQFLNYFKIY